jgi:hypothetical protein
VKPIKILLSIFFLLTFYACTPTPQNTDPQKATASPTPALEVTFEMRFGGSKRDRGIDLIQTRDGGYAIIGYTSSFGAGGEDIYLIRTDDQGRELWTRTYGGPDNDNGWAILETSDGNFVILGFTNSYGNGGMDTYLIKTDSQGNELWETTFGGPNNEYGWALDQTSDGGYVLAGQTDSFGEGGIDGYLIKVNSDGQELWSQVYGGPQEDRLFSIDSCADSGFILTGTTGTSSRIRDVYLVKTNADGELVWSQTFGEDLDDVGHAVRQTDEGGFIVAGYTKNFDASNYDTLMIKTDQDGNLEWQKLYGGILDDRTISIEQTQDQGFILVGYTQSFGGGNWDVFLVRTDPNGDVLWHDTFGGILEDTGYTVKQTPDHSFILTGETHTSSQGGGDLYFIKVEEESE